MALRQNGRERASLTGPRRVPSLLLLLDAFDSDSAEVGVFITNVRLELPLFDVERLDRVHVRELYEHHAIGRRGSGQADCFVKASGEVLAAGFFNAGLRLGQKILGIAVLIFHIDFGERVRRWFALRDGTRLFVIRAAVR